MIISSCCNGGMKILLVMSLGPQLMSDTVVIWLLNLLKFSPKNSALI